MPKSNRLIAALKENHNLVSMASAVALSAALLNPVPLLAALVAEAAYLLFVPDSKWYEARLAKRYDAEIEQQRQKIKEQTLPLLRPQVQQRFERLEETRRQIDAQCQEDKSWFREVLRKLDYLLDKFLMFAAKEVQFRAYLEQLHAEIRSQAKGVSRRDYDEPAARRGERNDARRTETGRGRSYVDVSPGAGQDTMRLVEEIQAHYTDERELLQQSLAAETDPATRSIVEKRADILRRRHEFVGKIGRILLNLNHQLQLVEDTFGLINDEIRARSPEQILADVEEVVIATDTMASSLEELASVEQMMTRIAS